MSLPPKAAKILALALDHAAADGEWRNAAVMFVGILRREGFTLADIATMPPRTAPRYAPRPRTARAVVMPFGMHKGEPLTDIPDAYLQWLTTCDLKAPLRAAVQAEIERRR